MADLPAFFYVQICLVGRVRLCQDITTRSGGEDGLFLLSLFFAKIKNSEEGDSSWQKDSLIFISSIIKTMKKQKF